MAFRKEEKKSGYGSYCLHYPSSSRGIQKQTHSYTIYSKTYQSMKSEAVRKEWGFFYSIKIAENRAWLLQLPESLEALNHESV